MNEKKPPLGLTPREIAEHDFNVFRIGEILGSMHRYSEAEKPIPVKWVDELVERIRNYMEEDKKGADD